MKTALKLLTILDTKTTKPALLADNLKNVSVLYSFSRRLLSSYTGPIIRILRSDDAEELDVYTNSSGDLDRSSVDSFVGSGSATVVTVYEQTGSGINATMPTTSIQPRIYNAFEFDLVGTRPGAKFFGGDWMVAANNAIFELGSNGCTVNVMFQLDMTDRGFLYDVGGKSGVSGPEHAIGMYWQTAGKYNLTVRGVGLYISEPGSIDANKNATNLVYGREGSDDWKFYVDGVHDATLDKTDATAVTNTASETYLGYEQGQNVANYSLVGRLAELIIIKGNREENQAIITANQIEYFGIERGFSPEDLDPEVWLDSSDLNTIILVGGLVSSWADKSSNGNDAVQSTADDRPLYSLGHINGLNAITFNGANEFLSILNDVTIQTAFVVCNNTSGATFTQFQAALVDNDTVVYIFLGDNGTTDWLIDTPDGTKYVNGTETRDVGTLATTAVSSNVLDVQAVFQPVIGKDRDLAGRWWDGDICEIIIYADPLTDVKRKLVENYLINKWGV